MDLAKTTKIWKIVSLILGITFVVSSFFIWIDPQPFLRFGYGGVFVFNLFSSSLLIMPALVSSMNVVLLALFSALGMSINDSVSWIVGYNSDVVLKGNKLSEKVAPYILRFGVFAIFIFALIPFPYDSVGIVVGYFKVPYWKYVISMFLGRFIRFVVIGYIVKGLI